MVVGHHLFLHRSPLIVTNYIDSEIKELDLIHYPRTKQSLKFLRLFLLYKNLVIGHHLFLHRSPFNVVVTNYITTLTVIMTIVFSIGVTLHASHAPPHPRTIQSSKFIKLLCCAESWYQITTYSYIGHHLL